MAEQNASILDVAFAMDCTSSMSSYIQQAQQSITNIVQEIVSNENSDIRLALVEYRDHPPQDTTFVTQVLNFTSSLTQMKMRLSSSRAHGGGDTPEAVADALFKVLQLSWRHSAIKICVFIADAPPHGLVDHGDHFPNGCPEGHDPMEIANDLAERGVSIYVVGCEPSISPYKDFFMAIARMTGGLYIPLSDSTSLAKVIIGAAKEEISLKENMDIVEQNIRQTYQRNGGIVDEESVSYELYEVLKHKKTKQLKLNGGCLPEVSPRAKRFARFQNMPDLKRKFVIGSSSLSQSGKASFTVEEKEIDILQVQRMVQKAIMINGMSS